MSLSQIRINGIRLGSRQNLVYQSSVNRENAVTQLYQILAQDRTNIVCLGLRTDASGTSVFCCHDIKSNKDSFPPGVKSPTLPIVSDVCTVSVYPHNASLNTLGFLMGLFGKHGIAFQQMVSSNAMLSFIIDLDDQEKVLAFLEQEFDLPPTHTPFQQDFNHETAEFVKKRYPETRATYVEERIKTYGIKLTTGLEMFELSFNPNQHNHLEICGKGLQGLAKFGKKFYFTAALTRSQNATLYCLTEPLPSTARQDFFSQVREVRGGVVHPLCVDLISFHGPHFGDRFGIFNTAMACLNEASINVLLAGCTGASICMVLPGSLGEKAIQALAKGFESP
jgi:aspartokinase